MQGERSGFTTLRADPEESGRSLAGPGERLTVTVPEAARLLGISRTSAYEAVHRGELPAISIGRRMVVPKVALHRLLDQAHVPRPEQA